MEVQKDKIKIIQPEPMFKSVVFKLSTQVEITSRPRKINFFMNISRNSQGL